MLYVNKIKTPLFDTLRHYITIDQVHLSPPRMLIPSQQVRV